jgi:hypothetical protein
LEAGGLVETPESNSNV